MAGVQVTHRDANAGINSRLCGDDNAVAPRRVESGVPVGNDGKGLPASERAVRSNGESFAEDLQSGANVSVVAQEVNSHFLENKTGVTTGVVPEEVAVVKREARALRGWPAISRFPAWYWSRLSGFNQSLDVYGFSPSWDQLIAFMFICFTLIVLGLIEHYGIHPLLNNTLSIFLPALGASCTVVYAVPKAPIAQPRNVIVAHVTAAIIGIALTNAFRSVKQQPFGQYCAGALGVALHLVLMIFTNTLHPPASATVISAANVRINAYYDDQGFLFVVTPVLFGALFTVICAWFLNNLVPSRSPYPQYW
ncbi:hypothetical protein JKF63_01610 [Porcisia hertigi]|uniref:HPP transmembrane region domain-containing protein n=1 Tax=Porcisia hertigi TaxID=2761500 RepID=A0A836LAZ5_9TRYP|nr:hypothetical protein JKF63_01610 [Porcisia hertigi]